MPMGTDETMRIYAAAWARGDVATILGLYSSDFVLHYAGTHRLSGTYRGKDTALAAMREFGALTQRRLIEIVDVMTGGAHGSIVAREQFNALPGAPVLRRLAVYRVEDGNVCECWVYDADQAAIDRLIG
jgi:ketosteroid isomerase-like protein